MRQDHDQVADLDVTFGSVRQPQSLSDFGPRQSSHLLEIPLHKLGYYTVRINSFNKLNQWMHRSMN